MTAGTPGGDLAHPVALVALASNVGDRGAHLAAARAAIATLRDTALLAASRIEETAPLGDIPQGPYLNQMVAVRTALSPEALLDALHAIERGRGRERRERWGPRTLDLDIVDFEGVVRHEGRIELPHPGLRARDFWQREVAELRSLMPPTPSVVVRDASSAADPLALPRWAVVSETRRAHIFRVVTLLEEWAGAMQVGAAERAAWRDAGRLHDALRDADELFLRAVVSADELPAAVLHGPAAGALLQAEGEVRHDVLEAVRHHTIGCRSWARTGRALYMADYLEPGRSFAREERAALAARVPADFDGVFAAVVRRRAVMAHGEGRAPHAATVDVLEELA